MGSNLSEQLDEIASVIGRDAMLALVAACGGTRIYIPAEPTDDHWLIDVLGRAHAEKLCAHFTVHGSSRSSGRGVHLEIPASIRSSYNKIQVDIGQLDDGKKSAREIALEAGVTQRTVHRHRRARRQKVKSA